MNIRIPSSLSLHTFLAVIAPMLITVSPVEARNTEPFTGEWVSKQYTNGKEFHLRIQQSKDDIVGWEGRLPPQQLPEPDFFGKIDGKEAEIEVTHRRGYKAHVKLSLRGDRLVWQLIDATGRSSRYFPLASTLIKQSESATSEKTQLLPDTDSRENNSKLIQPVSAPGAESSPANSNKAGVSVTPVAEPASTETSTGSASKTEDKPAETRADTGSNSDEPKTAPDFRRSKPVAANENK